MSYLSRANNPAVVSALAALVRQQRKLFSKRVSGGRAGKDGGLSNQQDHVQVGAHQNWDANLFDLCGSFGVPIYVLYYLMYQ